jgi:transposase
MQTGRAMKSPAALSQAEREQRLEEWACESGVELPRLDGMQRGVVLAALVFLSFVGGVPALRRMVAYLLSHSGLGLSSAVIGAVVGTTGRAVRKGRQAAPKEFWKKLQKARRGHPAPKLRKEQVGPVAKYLSEHPGCSVAEVLGFIRQSFGVEMDRLTLRRFLKRYGLGCLKHASVEDTPLLSDARPTEEPSR